VVAGRVCCGVGRAGATVGREGARPPERDWRGILKFLEVVESCRELNVW